MDSTNYNYDATFGKVIRPISAKRNQEFDDWVTGKSPKWQRLPVCKIRYYQYKECKDGNTMDDTDYCWDNLEVFTFKEHLGYGTKPGIRQVLIGAVGFEIDENAAILQFCWIHPFWRNRNLLTTAWPKFQARFGDFYVSKPRSKAMKAFLEKVNFKEPTGAHNAQ